MTNERSSSLPSRVVVVGPCMLFGVLTSSEVVDLQVWITILAVIGLVLISSFARVHMGSCYPSDCILSMPLIPLVIGFANLLRLIDA